MKLKIEERPSTAVDFALHNRMLWETMKMTQADIKPSDVYMPCNVVATDEGRVVGGAFGHSRLGIFMIESMWVAPEYRGRHLGDGMMEEMFRAARLRDCELVIGTAFSFHGSRSFCERHGGEIYAELPNPERGYTLYYFSKRLKEKPPV